MTLERARKHGPAFRQKGIAAIEFAFVFTVMLLALYGIATFGAVLYIQQAVSRAAEDGARAVTMLPTKLVTDDPQIQRAVRQSLAAALVVPNESNGNPADRLAWIEGNTIIKIKVTDGDPRATVTVSYDYSANRMLPSLPVLDISLWMPDDLIGKATATQALEGSST